LHNAVASAQEQFPPEQIKQGASIYSPNCAPCHGPEGDGGKGANLAQPVLPRGADDAALFRTLQDGIPGTEMPRAWEMTDHEVWQVAAFVRTLGRVNASEAATGNPARGGELVRSKGRCLQCHVIAGEGVPMGPELSTIGLRRNAAFLRKTLQDPKSTIPQGYFYVELATYDGKRVSGFRLSEDTYSVQVRDLSGQLHSYFRTELAEYRKDAARTPMPSFQGTFSDSEREDVIAYLLTQRGAR